MNLRKFIETGNDGTENNLNIIVKDKIDCNENEVYINNNPVDSFIKKYPNIHKRDVPKRSIHWGLDGNIITHDKYGNVDLSNIIKFETYEILTIVPLLEDYCLLLFIVNIDNKEKVFMRDLRYDPITKTSNSVIDFRFFLDEDTLEELKHEVKSTYRVEGTTGIGFLLRRLSGLGINCFCSDNFVNKKLLLRAKEQEEIKAVEKIKEEKTYKPFRDDYINKKPYHKRGK